MLINILCSDPSHPVMPWLIALVAKRSTEHEIAVINTATQLGGGSLLFLISCHEIVHKADRDKYEKTLVVHASDLPQGRGWSPHIWQIIEGKRSMAVSLLEAADGVDTGDLWKKVFVSFDGDELYNEINSRIFEAEINLIDWAIQNWNSVKPVQQSGQVSYYRKRTPEDSRIDPNLSIASQFDLLRVADPVRYPAFFELRDHKYKIVLEKM